MVYVPRYGQASSDLRALWQARKPSFRPLNSPSRATSSSSPRDTVSVGSPGKFGKDDYQTLVSVSEELADARLSAGQARSMIAQARQTASTAMGLASGRLGLSTQTTQLLSQAREMLLSNRFLSSSTPLDLPSILTSNNVGDPLRVSRTQTQLDLNSLETDWESAIGAGAQNILDFSNDSSGSSFVLSESTAPGSPTVLNKFNYDGSLLWTSQIGTGANNTSTNGMTVGQDGSVYVFGATTESLNNQPVPTSKDAFLIKYNADGAKAWTKVFGSTSNLDSAYDAEVGNDGSVYLTGIRNGEALITKFTSGGEQVWARQIGSSGEARGNRIAVGTDGSSYILGNSTGQISADGSQIGPGDFVTKYDANGTRSWIKGLGEDFDGANIAVSTGGDLFVQGQTESAAQGTTQVQYTNFVRKFSSDGIEAWSNGVGYSPVEGPYASFTEDFRTLTGVTNRGWTGSGNTSSGNNFGFNTGTSLGSSTDPGKIGGIIARTSAVNYFADTLIGSVSAASNELKLAGNFRMDFGTLDGEVRLGYFNPESGFGDFLGLRFREPLAGSNKVRATLVIGGALSEQVIEISQDTGLSFDLTWTGDSNGSGTLAGTIDGRTISFSGNAGTAARSAFGLLSGGTSDRPDRQDEVSGNIMFDNLTYSQEMVVPSENNPGRKLMAMGSDGSLYLAQEFADRMVGSVTREGGGGVVNGLSVVTKFNADGSEAWTTQLSGGGMENLSGIDVDSAGNVYAFGSSEGATYGGKVLSGGRDGFVTKLSSNGAKLSTQLIGGASDDSVRFLDVVGEGRVNIAGGNADASFVAGIRPNSASGTVISRAASAIPTTVDLSTDDSVSVLLSNLDSLERAMTKMEQDISRRLYRTNLIQSYSSRMVDSYPAASQATSAPPSEPIQSSTPSRRTKSAFLQSFLRSMYRS